MDRSLPALGSGPEVDVAGEPRGETGVSTGCLLNLAESGISLGDWSSPAGKVQESQQLAVIGPLSCSPDKPRHRTLGRGPYGKKRVSPFLRSVRSVVRVHPGPFRIKKSPTRR